MRPSAFDRPHKITISGTASLPFGFVIGLSYVGQSGTPYTWLVTGDVNGDGINGNDVPFVPANQTQISLQDPTQYAALARFIDSQSCLADAKGSFIPAKRIFMWRCCASSMQSARFRRISEMGAPRRPSLM